MAGAKAWWEAELSQAYDGMRHKDDVLLLGRTATNELSQLLAASEALVYPSYFEGFGIPILEAMHAETAVICSNTTSMPEVGGDAALYINPSSPDDIAKAILSIDDTHLRDSLIEKGRRQRSQYSWDKTASLLWDSMMRTLHTV